MRILFIMLLAAMFTSCSTTPSTETDLSRKKVRVKETFFSSYLGGYQTFKETEIRYVDTLYRVGDDVKLGAKTYRIVE